MGRAFEVHGQLTGDFHPTGAENVFPFGIFTVEGPVDAQLGNGDRPHIGVKIQLAAERYIGAFHIAALRRGGGAFEQNIAFFDFRQHILGHRRVFRQTVFNGEPLDIPKLHAAGGDGLFQQFLQYTAGLGNEAGADAVTADEADDDFFFMGEIRLFRPLIHAVAPLQLFFQ